MHKSILLWAVPRATSTAFEWMMRQRGDLNCLHERFGEAWYQGEDPLWPRFTEGEKITLMSGTKQSLVDRAGRVAKLAADTGFIERKDIRGALMIYCGGCMLSVQDELENVVANMVEAVGDAPFLGAFTFGEQGPLVGSGNRHGNLMISCIVFG